MRRIRKHGKTTEKKTDRILAGGRIPDGEIRVCDVEKYYGSDTNITKAVDRVSFCVQKGEFVGIMGASGSGKTTLLNMLSTIDRVTAGHIYYGETDITELSDEALAEFRKDNLGFIFQDYNLLDTLTIEENIVLAMTLHSKSKDEPTGALDSRAAQMLLETFRKMNRDMHSTILMVTHDAFSASYCSRILFLKDGKIFHELVRGVEERREFLNKILDVLSLTGGELSDVR